MLRGRLVASLMAALVLGTILGAWQARSTPERIAIAVERSKRTPASEIGRDYMVHANFTPIAVIRSANEEAIEYQLDFDPSNPSDMKVAYEVTVTDDLGGVVQNVHRESLAVQHDTPATGRTFQVSKLRDGFYRVEALIAAISPERNMAQRASQYLEVRGGRMNEISMNDYMMRSRARQSVAAQQVRGVQ